MYICLGPLGKNAKYYSQVVFLDRIPHNPQGKKLRHQLKETYSGPWLSPNFNVMHFEFSKINEGTNITSGVDVSPRLNVNLLFRCFAFLSQHHAVPILDIRTHLNWRWNDTQPCHGFYGLQKSWCPLQRCNPDNLKIMLQDILQFSLPAVFRLK